jgi:3-deoxy-7-phosphoheptulonate synthase
MAVSMMIVMKDGATDEQIEHVLERIASAGATAHISRGEYVTVIGAIGDDRQLVATLDLEGVPGVEKVVPILKPYKLVSREFSAEDLVVTAGGARIGGGSFGLIAGPCTVETREQTLTTAEIVKAAGAGLLRGGAYKPRSSPYTFQGLGKPALEILMEARELTGLPIVTELMDVRQIEDVVEVADMIQLGTRNMQNFDLLREVGRLDTPVLLKRGMSNTIEEWLLSAEYIAKEGNDQIVLCERGIRTFETATRGTLDISAIPVVKGLSRLPVIVDPSHAAGRRDLILPMARAAVVAGADGLIVEVHPDPEQALCDGPQALRGDGFSAWVADVKRCVDLMGKIMAGGETAVVGAA